MDRYSVCLCVCMARKLDKWTQLTNTILLVSFSKYKRDLFLYIASSKSALENLSEFSICTTNPIRGGRISRVKAFELLAKLGICDKLKGHLVVIVQI
jgi:hypothetical protein